MPKTLLINRIGLRIGLSTVTVVIIKQSEVSISVREELGHVLLIDAADCGEMFLLASLFNHSFHTHDVIFFERKDESGTDLFVFNGAITPLTRKNLSQIKSSIKYLKPKLHRITLIGSHDEAIWDTWEHWKYNGQLKVKADRDIGIINSSKLGFELLVHQCSYLASSYSGHSHFDGSSTNSSIELIIRNIARN